MSIQYLYDLAGKCVRRLSFVLILNMLNFSVHVIL